MEIIIGDKKYNTWDEPILPKKNSKNKIVSIVIYDKFDHILPEVIILNKTYYKWVLKGCKLIKQEDIGDRFMDSKIKRTRLTISYQDRSGSHLKNFVKSEIRDYLLSKVFKSD
jgi:hypothetical protein